MISKQHHSLTQLQIELRSQGYSHSQQTILEEYVTPMIEVGLVQEDQNPYAPTLLGSKINELVKDLHELEHALPAHSECYEEKVLDILLEGSKTSEEIKNIIPTKSAPRVLSRMQKAGLLQTPKEKDYIFFSEQKEILDCQGNHRQRTKCITSFPNKEYQRRNSQTGPTYP
jgi:hypothetical protein